MTIKPIDPESLKVYREWLTAGLISRSEYRALTRGGRYSSHVVRGEDGSAGIVHRAKGPDRGRR